MMFDTFRRNFPRDATAPTNNELPANAPEVADLRELFRAFGGATFRDGLYRIIRPADLKVWSERVSLAFPQFDKRIVCFGYDWLGRTFALDFMRLEGGQPGVVMFVPGTGEALEIPSNIRTFHEAELTKFGEAALAISFYEEWRASGGAAPAHSQCIGYRIPLFLGGVDEVENLEVSDLDVYWNINGQLIVQTRGLPEGTRLRIKTPE